MQVQRTITLSISDDADLKATLAAFVTVQQSVTETAFGTGKPLSAMDLHRACYDSIKGTLNSQMTLTAMRLVVGSYASAMSNHKRRAKLEAKRKARHASKGWKYKAKELKPVGVSHFVKPAAMFLIGQRGRDASFKKDGTLSIWTVSGRKHIPYTVPDAFRERFESAIEYDSLTVIERNGKLYGRLCLTLEVPEPKGVSPVGVDLNETNALVAVDAEGRELFITGRETKILNRRTMQVVGKVQQKLATRKAEGKDTRSVVRVLKRLSGKRKRRTNDFAKCTAKKLVQWAPTNAVLVFEKLDMQAPMKGLTRGARLRQRLSLWQRTAIRDAAENAAQLAGMAIGEVDPYHTSQLHHVCGLKGRRKRHDFYCPGCDKHEHADVNAAFNIRNKFVQLRLDGAQSIAPEALVV